MKLRYIPIVVVAIGSCKSEPPATKPPTTEPPTTAPAAARTQPNNVAAPVKIPAVTPPRAVESVARKILSSHGITDREPALHISAPAPALKVDGWLTGKPIALQRKRVYVIENWATWCKPCIEQMPHLATLAERYANRGVVVIAVNVEDESAGDAVRKFVAEHRATMRYPVAYERGGKMQAQWIARAGLRGLPASFVVDRDGRIAWMGHPEQLGRVVAKVVAGKWDYRAERQRAARERLAVPYSQRVVKLLASDPDRAYELVRVLLGTILVDQPEYLHGLAYHIFAAPNVARRDLTLAYTAGALACQANRWSKPEMIETLSKIRERQGRLDAAIALQRRAVSKGAGAGRFTERLATLTAARAK